MATMTVRNLPDDVHRRVKLYAVERGISTEAAARELLDYGTRSPEMLGDTLADYAQARNPLPLDLERDKDPIQPAAFQ